MDTPQKAKPAFEPFDHKIPLVGVDPDEPEGLIYVCFNGAWLPHILGVLGALSRVEIWDTEDFALRNLEAQRGEDLLTIFAENCQGSAMQLRACDCGIEWSNDGINWTCINLSGCIADIVGIGIDAALADMTLTPGSGNTGPGERPGFMQCKTIHVHMFAGQTRTINIPVAAGDTVNCTNFAGSWWTIDSGVFWSCLDGRVMVLGNCLDNPLDPGPNDIYQDMPHMTLVAKVGEEHFNAAAGLFTVGGDSTQRYVQFQANGNSDHWLYDGEADFDVEICQMTTEIGITYQFDHPNPSSVTTGEEVEFAFYAHPTFGAGYLGIVFDVPVDIEIIGYTGSYSGTPAGNTPFCWDNDPNQWNPMDGCSISYQATNNVRSLAIWNTTAGETITLRVTAHVD